MRTFLLDFQERRREVRRYLAALKTLENQLPEATTRKYDLEARILRASALLVIYNAVEASARSAIEAIYDEFRQKDIAFDYLRRSIREKILADFRKNGQTERLDTAQSIAYGIVHASLNRKKIFSGSVDAREIRAHAVHYGFDMPNNNYQRTKNGEDLRRVLENRIDLAHGLKSFSQVGNEYTLREIISIGRYCIAYMNAVLENVDHYLDEERYLEESA